MIMIRLIITITIRRHRYHVDYAHIQHARISRTTKITEHYFFTYVSINIIPLWRNCPTFLC